MALARLWSAGGARARSPFVVMRTGHGKRQLAANGWGDMRMATDMDVAVIGAGPYGLSLAAHLAERGLRFRIFGRPMHSWRANMPPNMRLKSVGCASSLSDPTGRHSLAEYCAEVGFPYSDWAMPISGELFAGYGEWFQQRAVPELDTRYIAACDRAGTGFALRTADGEAVAARSVVVCTGYMESAWSPPVLQGLPQALISHSSSHRSFAPFDGKKVIVVGAGQSALESAALLQEAGAEPTVVARRRPIVWGARQDVARTLYENLRHPRAETGFGWSYRFLEHPATPFHFLPASRRRRLVETTLGPFGAPWLRERVEGRLPVLTGCQLQRVEQRNGGVVLELETDGEAVRLAGDHLIAATGYRISQASFPFLSPTLRDAVRWEFGAPALSFNFESTASGLHFLGLASAYSFGPVMRFVAGAHRAVPRLARYLAARHGVGVRAGAHRSATRPLPAESPSPT
jgi:thioredoxin reductase